MKMLQQEKSGGIMEAALVVCAVIFLGLAISIYRNRDETQGAKALTSVEEVQDVSLKVESDIDKMKAENLNFHTNIVTTVDDLQKRMLALERRSVETINLKFHEPVMVKMIEDEHHIPPQISGKSLPASLLKKAGIKTNN
jgi:hypothetical protein